MGGDSLSTLVNIKSIIKLANTSYHSLCTSGISNVPTAIFNTCFNCDPPDHDIGILPQKKDHKKITGNNNKLVNMKQSQGGNVGGKKWAKHSKNKGQANKSKNQQKSDKKANGDTKSNNGIHIFERNWMCLYDKGCGFNTSHTTGCHDT